MVAGSDTAFGTGTLTINGGTLQASGTRTLANAVTVGGNFAIGGGATDSLTLSGTIGLGAGTRIITVNSTGSTTLVGVISGTALLSKAGAGSLILSGANTYSGGTTVSAGILQATGGNNRLGTSGTVTINAGGTIDLSGNDQTLATLTGAGNLSNIGSLTVNAGTFSGPISGAGTLTKATAGSLTLSGANTYSGGTTLSLGTLIAGSDSAFGTGTLTISGVTTLQASGIRSLSNNVAIGGNFTMERHWHSHHGRRRRPGRRLSHPHRQQHWNHHSGRGYLQRLPHQGRHRQPRPVRGQHLYQHHAHGRHPGCR